MNVTGILNGLDDCSGDSVHIAWVFTNNKMGEFVNSCLSGLDKSVEGGFADSIKTVLVRHHSHEKPVLPTCTHRVSFDRRNFHLVSQ